MGILVDPYQVASMGYNSKRSYTIASLGILYDIEITPIPPEPPLPIEDIGGSNLGIDVDQYGVEKKKKQKYKIKVTAWVDGKEYSETKIVEKDVMVTTNDVDLNFDKNEKKIIIKMK